MRTLQVAAFPKQNGSRPRTVVFTQGKDATVVASHGKVCRGSCPGMGDLWDAWLARNCLSPVRIVPRLRPMRVLRQGISCGCWRRSSCTLSSLSPRRSWWTPMEQATPLWEVRPSACNVQLQHACACRDIAQASLKCSATLFRDSRCTYSSIQGLPDARCMQLGGPETCSAQESSDCGGSGVPCLRAHLPRVKADICKR